MSALAADPSPSVWRFDLPGRSVALFEGELNLGRSRGCGIVLADPCISRVHALVTIRAGRVFVQDLRSSNGTFVNGERILEERELVEGDRLAIGNFDLMLCAGAPVETSFPGTVTNDPDADPAADLDPGEAGATREMDAEPSLWQRFTDRLRG